MVRSSARARARPAPVVHKKFEELNSQELRTLLHAGRSMQILAQHPANDGVLIKVCSKPISRSLVLSACKTARNLAPNDNIWRIEHIRAPVVAKIMTWIQEIASGGTCFPYPLGEVDKSEIIEHVEALYRLNVSTKVSMPQQFWHYLEPAQYIEAWFQGYDQGYDWAVSSLSHHFARYCNDCELEDLCLLQSSIGRIMSWPESALCRDVERSDLKHVMSKGLVPRAHRLHMTLPDAIRLWRLRCTEATGDTVDEVADRLWKKSMTDDHDFQATAISHPDFYAHMTRRFAFKDEQSRPPLPPPAVSQNFHMNMCETIGVLWCD